MLLTVSKRVEFSASRRLFSPPLTAEENRRLYGRESEAVYGTGRNYAAYFVFAGQPDPVTGMLINISEIKERAGAIIRDFYDHRFLNEDNPCFHEEVPTAENIARHLFSAVAPLFRGERAQLAAVHLRETPERSATAYATGPTDANHWLDFSAARTTGSPHLTDSENRKLFGASFAEHGHNYRVRLTFNGESPPQSEIDSFIEMYRRLLDHKNLNREVEPLRSEPITTESLARMILRLGQSHKTTLGRVRLHETENFLAEAWADGRVLLGMREAFSAAHRLNVGSFPPERNAEMFGKCNNARGHGHTYVTEVTIGGTYDERSGTVSCLDELQATISRGLHAWRDKHLDLETAEFRAQPSTGENIVRALWQKLDPSLDQQMARLRLWETANNRFTLRRI